MTMPIVELRKATKKYAGVPAIEDIDFALLPGEIHTLVGENGAGKSTLTKAMAGVVPLTSGQKPRCKHSISASQWCFRRPVWCLR
jgi:simple sugar transport system ATP-binding protein